MHKEFVYKFSANYDNLYFALKNPLKRRFCGVLAVLWRPKIKILEIWQVAVYGGQILGYLRSGRWRYMAAKVGDT